MWEALIWKRVAVDKKTIITLYDSLTIPRYMVPPDPF